MTLDMRGTFVLVRNENLDAYLSAVGVPYLVRIMILKTSPSLTVTVDEDGLWRIERKSMMSANAVEFRLNGEEFTEKMSSGVETKSVAVADGDRIVISCDTNGIEEERTWSLNEGGELVQHLWLKQKNIVAERIYKRT